MDSQITEFDPKDTRPLFAISWWEGDADNSEQRFGYLRGDSWDDVIRTASSLGLRLTAQIVTYIKHHDEEDAWKGEDPIWRDPGGVLPEGELGQCCQCLAAYAREEGMTVQINREPTTICPTCMEANGWVKRGPSTTGASTRTP